MNKMSGLSKLATLISSIVALFPVIGLAQSPFGFADWRGSYSITSDGAVRACGVEAVFTTGDRLKFWLTSDFQFHVAMQSSSGWGENRQALARLWVDDGRAVGANIAIEDRLIQFSLGPLKGATAVFFQSMRMGRILFVDVGGAIQKYNLHGTYGALSELHGCARQIPSKANPPASHSNKGPIEPGTRATPPPVSRPQSVPSLESTASAFLVSKNGHVLTNAHAIDGCTEVRVTGADGRTSNSRVVATDKQNDLAILQVMDFDSSYLSFRKDSPKLGEATYAYGFPLSSLLATSGNFSAGTISALVGVRNNSSRLQFSAPVQPGNSGGPLLDARGAVIGVVVQKLNAIGVAERTGDIPQNVNFAIKGSVALIFLEAYGVSAQVSDARRDLNSTEVADIARKASYRVDCFK